MSALVAVLHKTTATRWIDTETAAKLIAKQTGVTITGRHLRRLLDEGRLPEGIARRLPLPNSFVRWNREQLLAWASSDIEDAADDSEE